jgi:uncharacterized protein DUF2795
MTERIEVVERPGWTGMDEEQGPLMGEGAGRVRRRRAVKTRAGSRRASDGQTKAELYEEAKRLGIENRSKMNKAQLARAVSRRRGRSQSKANPFDVQAFLEGVGYPTGKRRLLREAESQGADHDVRSTLRRLPDRSFESPTEVSEAIGKLS